jgi:uncharacterized membrane protein
VELNPVSRLVDRVHPAVLYTAARLGVFVVIAALLFLVGFRSWILVLVALALSAPVSYFLLRNQRDAYAERIEGRISKRRAEKERLRSALAGDDEL